MIPVALRICPGYGWMGGPVFDTRIVTSKSGMERRNANMAQPRHQYTLPLQNVTNTEYLQELKALFMVARGCAESFLAKDFSDFEFSPLAFAQGDGVATDFELFNVYTFGGLQFKRRILHPHSGLVLTVDNADTPATVAGGRVQFSTPPADGALIAARGGFDIGVRFATDDLQLSIDNVFGQSGEYAMNGSVQLIEVFE